MSVNIPRFPDFCSKNNKLSQASRNWEDWGVQGFPNNSKEWVKGKFPPSARDFLLRGESLLAGGNQRRSDFDQLKPFSKLKIAFCEYWTSIKAKISVTCLFKEYETKTKMVYEQWLQLKMLFLLGYNLEIVI